MKHEGWITRGRDLGLVLLLAASSAPSIAEEVSRTIALKDVRSIEVEGDYEIHISQGNEEYVRLTAEADDIERIKAVVRNDRLRIGHEGRGFWQMFGSHPPARFDIQLRDFTSIRIGGSGATTLGPLRVQELKLAHAGSGSIRGDSIEASELEIELAGSGRLNLASVTAPRLDVEIAGSGRVVIQEGRVEQQDIEITGSGNYQAPQLASQNASVEIAGSAEVELMVEQQLKVEIAGSARVRYRGDPTVRTDIAGSGDIRRID